jgi:hypothetical protein
MSAPDPEEARWKRNKLWGRVMIVALGLLIAAYVAATFLR